ALLDLPTLPGILPGLPPPPRALRQASHTLRPSWASSCLAAGFLTLAEAALCPWYSSPPLKPSTEVPLIPTSSLCSHQEAGRQVGGGQGGAPFPGQSGQQMGEQGWRRCPKREGGNSWGSYLQLHHCYCHDALKGRVDGCSRAAAATTVLDLTRSDLPRPGVCVSQERVWCVCLR
ncbi:hypothetical protein E2320_002836, partial [Naja naja]